MASFAGQNALPSRHGRGTRQAPDHEVRIDACESGRAVITKDEDEDLGVGQRSALAMAGGEATFSI